MSEPEKRHQREEIEKKRKYADDCEYTRDQYEKGSPAWSMWEGLRSEAMSRIEALKKPITTKSPDQWTEADRERIARALYEREFAAFDEERIVFDDVPEQIEFDGDREAETQLLETNVRRLPAAPIDVRDPRVLPVMPSGFRDPLRNKIFSASFKSQLLCLNGFLKKFTDVVKAGQRADFHTFPRVWTMFDDCFTCLQDKEFVRFFPNASKAGTDKMRQQIEKHDKPLRVAMLASWFHEDGIWKRWFEIGEDLRGRDAKPSNGDGGLESREAGGGGR
jgi:hypothetical protein